MALTPKYVYRDFSVDGVPSSGFHMPDKHEIVQLLVQMQNNSGAAVSRATLASLTSVTPEAGEFPRGEVLNDPVKSRNGWYTWNGGEWVFDRGFPDTLASLVNVTGTGNAIVANTDSGIDPADAQLLILPSPIASNSAGTVTISINGAPAQQIKAANGGPLAAGDILEAVATAFFRFEDEWRQIYPASTAPSLDHQGNYSAGTTYTEGQVVSASDGNWYQLKTESAIGDDPVSGGSGNWLLILVASTTADGSITFVKLASSAIATKAQAQAYTNSNTLMTPQRTREAFASMLDFYQGYEQANNPGDPNNAFEVNPGKAQRAGAWVVSSVKKVKLLNALWAVGDGAGSLDVGAKSASKSYHIHIIRRDSDGLDDVLASLSPTAPTVPAGWSRIARVGCILTDGSANIVRVFQDGNEYTYTTPPSPSYSSSSTRAKAALALPVPTGVRCEVVMQLNMVKSNGDSNVEFQMYDGANPTAVVVEQMYDSGGTGQSKRVARQKTDLSGQIQFAVTGAPLGSTPSTLTVLGWRDLGL
jgi:hypothetical protein